MLEQKLEEIKQLGHYAVTLWYGEQDVGGDDSDIPQNKHKIIILAYPVGCLGEVKILWKGNLKKLKNFDFADKPKKIDNPLKKEQYENDGFYCWGTDRMIDDWRNRR